MHPGTDATPIVPGEQLTVELAVGLTNSSQSVVAADAIAGSAPIGATLAAYLFRNEAGVMQLNDDALALVDSDGNFVSVATMNTEIGLLGLRSLTDLRV